MGAVSRSTRADIANAEKARGISVRWTMLMLDNVIRRGIDMRRAVQDTSLGGLACERN